MNGSQQQKTIRRDIKPVVKPAGRYPHPAKGREAHRNPIDVTGVNPDHMKAIHPGSIYIPPP
ncbi:MAG: hypothetical protein GXX84_01985 [Acidobacteria bacterium]|nr:hypothetical protein [Acidobacteriota bacterium]